MSARIQVQPSELNLWKDADADFKKNARRLLRQASDVLLNHTKYQLLRRRGNEVSAPGEPPVSHTGKLAKSFKRIRVRLRKGYGSAGITSSHPAAYALEWGETVASRTAFKITGQRGRRIANKFLRGLGSVTGLGVYRLAPRPYLQPAADESEDEITKILIQVLE